MRPTDPEIFDVWLVPEGEASRFAFQAECPSAAVMPVGDDPEARAEWEGGSVQYDAPVVRVPARALDAVLVEEAVRRWAGLILDHDVVVRSSPALHAQPSG